MSYQIAHRLWQRLPRDLRRQVFARLTPLFAPRPDRAPTGGLPVGIAGLFSTAGGLGEGARLTYSALETAGLQPSAFDLSAAFDQFDLPPTKALRPLKPGTGGSLVVHHNAPYIPYALWALGAQQTRGRRIIGYWAWELPRLPASWQTGLRFVHEVWVPSRFTQSAVAAATDLPVHVVPHPLPAVAATPLQRSDFDIAEHAVVVLNVFHLGSTLVRKNPLAAVAAFRRAFGESPDHVLLIKLINPGNVPAARQRFEQSIAGAPNIRVIERMLPAAEMTGLLAMSDIIISLHRAEGFGLVPAEAMRLGKPVVATGWSGNLDFMSERNSALIAYKLVPVQDPENFFEADGQLWADPDIDHAAEWLRRLADSAALRCQLGTAAAAAVAAQLSPERIARVIRDLLARPPAPAMTELPINVARRSASV
jgi:glycosyltransferase involved in cell wall biosynthesis